MYFLWYLQLWIFQAFFWVDFNFKPLPCLGPSQCLPISVSVKIPKYLQNIFFCYIFIKWYTRNFGFSEVFIVTNLKLWFNNKFKKRLLEKVVTCFPKELFLFLRVVKPTNTIRVKQHKVGVSTASWGNSLKGGKMLWSC